jgi:GT2 family glycosyltransferase
VSVVRSVAVVIPTWNSLGLLPDCLDSLRDQDPDLELMVVDNGSGDGSVAFLQQRQVPHLSLPRNVGFASAVNLGAARTAAPLVLVLNVDTVLEPGCIAVLREAVDADPSLGGVQPRILQLEGDAGAPESVEGARIYSVGQALTRDGRAIEEAAGERPEPRGSGAEGAVRRLRRCLSAAARAVRRARRLRRALFRLLRGRRPQRARPDRRLALRLRP